MNLKDAAQRLGVHYQTVYRWVRSGELTAMRIRGRSEISDAAIHQFVAGRRAVLLSVREPARDGRRVTDLTFDDLLEELEAMSMDPIVAVSAVATFTARTAVPIRSAGDVCFVVKMDDDGEQDRLQCRRPARGQTEQSSSPLPTMLPRPNPPPTAATSASPTATSSSSRSRSSRRR